MPGRKSVKSKLEVTIPSRLSSHVRSIGRLRARQTSRARTTNLNRARNLGLKNVRTGGLLDVEVKFRDHSLVGSALQAPTDASGGEYDPGTFLCLNGVAQGDTASTRDGAQISMRSIEIEGVVTCPAQTNQTAVEYAPSIFLALVLDTQTNGAQLNSEDVYANPGANAITAAYPVRNMSNTERFKVLKRWKFRMPVPAVTYDGTNIEQSGVQMPFRCFKNLGGLKTKWVTGNTDGVVGGIVDNSLHLIGWCNDTGMAPSVSYNSRLRFVG